MKKVPPFGLKVPHGNKYIYKIMRAEDLLSSITKNYLYFKNVEKYKDKHDGEQTSRDRELNESWSFKNVPDSKGDKYFDKSRARTYACCFSLENSNYIWNEYGNGSEIGKVCVVLKFGKLRTMLERCNSDVRYDGIPFDLSYGIVEYDDRSNHSIWEVHGRGNNILNTYFKDKKYKKEKEFRIALFPKTHGLYDGNPMEFPDELFLVGFDFRAAIANNTVQEIKYAHGCDSDFIKAELSKLGIMTQSNKD